MLKDPAIYEIDREKNCTVQKKSIFVVYLMTWLFVISDIVIFKSELLTSYQAC